MKTLELKLSPEAAYTLASLAEKAADKLQKDYGESDLSSIIYGYLSAISFDRE